MVLDVAKGAPAEALSDAEERAEALEEMIAAHRAALRELAPRQDVRANRHEAQWHMERLGYLLRVRAGECPTAEDRAAVRVAYTRHHGGSCESSEPDHGAR